MRPLIFELRPGALAEEGLVRALRNHAEAVAAKHGLVIDVQAPSDRLTLDATVEENVYRLVQEALSNVVRHARATQVTVRLAAPEPGSPAVELEVTDDGVGFDPGQREPGHFGLGAMAERAAVLGGNLQVASSPGGGPPSESGSPPRLRRSSQAIGNRPGPQDSDPLVRQASEPGTGTSPHGWPTTQPVSWIRARA